jgi:hypothetical protein
MRLPVVTHVVIDALLGCLSVDLSLRWRTGAEVARQGGHDLIGSLAVPHQCIVCTHGRVSPSASDHQQKGHHHRDTNHLAVLTDAEKPLADAEFPTNPAGYDDANQMAQSFGTVAIAGVEGTSSYGVGLTRVLQATAWPCLKTHTPALPAPTGVTVHHSC